MNNEQLIINSSPMNSGMAFLRTIGNKIYSRTISVISSLNFPSLYKGQEKRGEISLLFGTVQKEMNFYQIEQNVKIFHKGTFEELIASEKKQLNKTEKEFQKVWNTQQNKLSLDQMVAFRQFSEMKERWNKTFDQLNQEMNGLDDLKEIYRQEEKLSSFIRKESKVYSAISEMQPYYPTQQEKREALKKETLQIFLEESFGDSKSEEGKTVDAFSRWNLMKLMRDSESCFRPKIEDQLIEDINRIKSLSNWEECLSQLSRYVDNSFLLEGIEYMWNNRENPDFDLAVSNFVKDIGFKTYMDALERGKILPGKIELEAYARKDDLHIRLYSSTSKSNYTDYGWSKVRPDLIFVEDEKGAVSQLM